MFKRWIGSFAIVLMIPAVVQADLISRLGGLAYYDTDLNITWLADASFLTTLGSGPRVVFDEAVSLADSLSVAGVTGWRLPSLDVNGDGVVVDCTGGGVAGCIDNEFGYLYWETGINSFDEGPFSGILGSRYWADSFVEGQNQFWAFNFVVGRNELGPRDTTLYAWAVRDGDVGVIPVPAAVWLFGSGLIGLIGIARRRV